MNRQLGLPTRLVVDFMVFSPTGVDSRKPHAPVGGGARAIRIPVDTIDSPRRFARRIRLRNAALNRFVAAKATTFASDVGTAFTSKREPMHCSGTRCSRLKE